MPCSVTTFPEVVSPAVNPSAENARTGPAAEKTKPMSVTETSYFTATSFAVCPFPARIWHHFARHDFAAPLTASKIMSGKIMLRPAPSQLVLFAALLCCSTTLQIISFCAHFEQEDTEITEKETPSRCPAGDRRTIRCETPGRGDRASTSTRCRAEPTASRGPCSAARSTASAAANGSIPIA